MRLEGLADLTADPHHGVERGRWILEDHADFAAANRTHVALGKAEQIASTERDAPVDDASRLGYYSHD